MPAHHQGKASGHRIRHTKKLALGYGVALDIHSMASGYHAKASGYGIRAMQLPWKCAPEVSGGVLGCKGEKWGQGSELRELTTTLSPALTTDPEFPTSSSCTRRPMSSATMCSGGRRIVEWGRQVVEW